MFPAAKIIHLVLSVIIFTAALAGGAYRLDEPPWESGHQGFEMGNYPHYAKNYLRYGYLKTKLGLVLDFSDCPPEQFTYRVDYGFVSPLLISFAYQILDISDFAARAAPLTLSLICLLAVYFLAWRVTENRWFAPLAVLLCLLSPRFVYYARMPSPHTMATAFVALSALFYWRWFETKNRANFYLLLAVGFFGAFTEWVQYFIFPFLLLHYLLFKKEKGSRRAEVILAAAPFFFFTLHLCWAYLLNGKDGLIFLWSKFLSRTDILSAVVVPRSFSEVFSLFLSRSLDWFPYSMLTLLALWLLSCVYKSVAKRLSAVDGFLLALLGAAAAYDIVFRNLVYFHDFCMFYHFLPIVAVICVRALTTFVRAFQVSRTVALSALLMLPMYDYLLAGTFYWRSYKSPHRMAPVEPESYNLGKAINKSVSQCGHYIDAVNFKSPVLGAVADRKRTVATSTAEIKRALNTGNNELLLLKNSAQIDPALRAFLTETYVREEMNGYSLFLLKK